MLALGYGTRFFYVIEISKKDSITALVLNKLLKTDKNCVFANDESLSSLF